MEATTYLTTQDAAAALGVTERTVRRMIDAGQLPGAIRISGPRSPWRVPTTALRNADTPAPTGGSAGVSPRTQEPATRPRYDTPRTPASALILDVVATASRHQPDRDARCQHCGWTWPCPDATDLTAALDSALATLTDGGTL